MSWKLFTNFMPKIVQWLKWTVNESEWTFYAKPKMKKKSSFEPRITWLSVNFANHDATSSNYFQSPSSFSPEMIITDGAG